MTSLILAGDLFCSLDQAAEFFLSRLDVGPAIWMGRIKFLIIHRHALQMNDAIQVVALLPELILVKSHVIEVAMQGKLLATHHSASANCAKIVLCRFAWGVTPGRRGLP